jgi:hypothetical protein
VFFSSKNNFCDLQNVPDTYQTGNARESGSSASAAAAAAAALLVAALSASGYSCSGSFGGFHRKEQQQQTITILSSPMCFSLLWIWMLAPVEIMKVVEVLWILLSLGFAVTIVADAL